MKYVFFEPYRLNLHKNIIKIQLLLPSQNYLIVIRTGSVYRKKRNLKKLEVLHRYEG